MSKLYELTAEEQKLQELFLMALDEETGEIKDNDILEKMEEELKTAITVKSTGIIKALRQQELDIETVNSEIERLKSIKDKMTKANENFKKYIKFNMSQMNIKKIETPLGKLSLRQTTATEIYDEGLIPKEFMKEKITYTASKTEIKKALESGQDVQGARLIVNTSLIIK